MTDIIEKEKSLTDLLGVINVGDVAMFTTHGEGGHLHSRPMEICHVTDEGDVFFFTTTDSDSTEEITEHGYVNLSIVNHDDYDYVSISGAAYLSKNPSELKNFWRDEYYKWIPEGIDDPKIALLKVKPNHAEHWGTKSDVVSLAKRYVFGSDSAQPIHETMD